MDITSRAEAEGRAERLSALRVGLHQLRFDADHIGDAELAEAIVEGIAGCAHYVPTGCTSGHVRAPRARRSQDKTEMLGQASAELRDLKSTASANGAHQLAGTLQSAIDVADRRVADARATAAPRSTTPFLRNLRTS